MTPSVLEVLRYAWHLPNLIGRRIPERKSASPNLLQKIKDNTIITPINDNHSLYQIPIYHPLAKGLDGLSILLLTDLHAEPGRSYDLSSFLKEEYDIIAIGGDIIDTTMNGIGELNWLGKLQASKKKVYVLGDHDFKYGKPSEIHAAMKELGYHNGTEMPFHLQYNDTPFTISGINHFTSKPQADEHLDGHFNILLLHNLDWMDEGHNYNLVLSGHLHQGEGKLRIWNWEIQNGHHWIVGSGIYKNHWGQLQQEVCYLTEDTCSVISPGLHSNLYDFLGRVLSKDGRTPGPVVLTLHDSGK